MSEKVPILVRRCRGPIRARRCRAPLRPAARRGRAGLALAAAALIAGVVIPVGIGTAEAGQPELEPNAGAAAVEPPETTITSGPQGVIRSDSVSFGFASTEPGSRFECRLDGGIWTLRASGSTPVPKHVFDPGWEPCRSPTSYSGLAGGSHTFEVQARGPDGVDDPSPASRSFTVETGVSAIVAAAKAQRQRRKRIRVTLEVRAGEVVSATVTGKIKVRKADRRGRRRYALEATSRRFSAGETALLRLVPSRESAERKIVRSS